MTDEDGEAEMTSDPDLLELTKRAQANLSVPALYEAAIRRGECILASGGPLVVRTGSHTSRSPSDRFIVEEASSKSKIWWNGHHRPFPEDRYVALRKRVVDHLRKQEGVYLQDCFVGADPDHRRSLRVITDTAWQSIYAENLFIRPTSADLDRFRPDFLVIDASSFAADPAKDGTRTGTFILIHPGRREILIGGTSYAGEIKASVFAAMSYLLPEEGVLPIHASANVGHRGDVAVFFGLTGTGKTCLSADPARALIGDDEHGWSEHGIFNLEGGCDAKLIRLSPTAEPEIYATTRRFGWVLENVVCDPITRELDLDSDEITENTRGVYPLDFIANASDTGLAGHPSNVIFLTSDAFGVLPPISRLTPAQASYHFMSGYTARVPGAEAGTAEPSATFSACYGAPFMPRHPGEYAKLLADRIARHRATVWLVNTGWTGGPFGVGHRVRIQYTRAMVRAALEGKLTGVPTVTDGVFGIEVPTACPDVPAEVLQPRATWASKPTYDAQARKLAHMFAENFEQFAGGVSPEVLAAGPRTDG